MKKTFFSTLILFSSLPFISAQALLNTTLAARWDNNTLPIRDSLQYNECWGFEKNGREYGVIGSLEKTHFIEVTNPAAIYEVQNFTNGANSIWRDYKYYKGYIYGVADEGSEGLKVFNVNNINATTNRVTQVFSNNTTFSTCHNIWIDTIAGRLYCAGTNTRSDGIIVFDIKTNPANPTVCGNFALRSGVNASTGYVHDVHVYGTKMYCSHIYTGRMDVYDITSVNNWLSGNSTITSVTRLGFIKVPNSGYNHSSYLTEDKTKLIMAEETHGRPLTIVDITDPTDITVTSSIYSCTECSTGQNVAPQGQGSLVHNPFVKGNLVFLAYYHEGLVVYDISNPAAPFKVAQYDTDYPNRSTNYFDYYGAWGAYPYLPSQRVLVSDILNGLFVINLAPSLLPVEWSGFRVWQEKTNVNLRWSTAQERNTSHFEVERSNDGLNFAIIAKKASARNARKENIYEFVDETPFQGNNYYRIKQVDENGKISYTDIQNVKFKIRTNEPVLFPNPMKVGNEINLLFTQNVKNETINIEIYDVKGQLISQNSMAFAKSVSLRENLSVGTYFMKIILDADDIYTKKIIIE